MIKDEKLDSVSGGGIKAYEAMVKKMFEQGYTPDQILKALQDNKDSISQAFPGTMKSLAVNASNGTGYDKIQYEINCIDTVITRLQNNVYPKISWR